MLEWLSKFFTEEAENQSEQRFKALVAGIKEYAIIMLDPAGKVTSWNPGAERILGYSEHEIMGQHFSTFYTPEAKAAGHAENELIVATREGRYEEEGPRVRKNGDHFWAKVVLTAVRNASGRLTGFAKVTKDITEQQKAEEHLRKMNEDLEARAAQKAQQLAEREAAILASEQHLRLITDSLPALVAYLGKDRRYVTNNKAYEKWYGTEFRNVVGRHISEVVGVEGFKIVKPHLDRAFDGNTVSYDYPMLIGTRTRHLEVNYIPDVAPDGQVRGVITLVSDLTQRKRSEDEIARLNRDLRRRVQELQTILDVAPVGIAVSNDPQCEQMRVNTACAQMFGIARSGTGLVPLKASIEPPFQILSLSGEAVRTHDLPMLQAVREGREILGFEVDIVKESGDRVNMVQYAVPLFDENNEVRGCLGMFVDISERKRSEVEISKAKEAAEAANEAKSAFLANMSHEIRTPLGAVIGFSELLVNLDQSPSERNSAVDAIKRNGELLSNIVNDILDLSKIEAGRLEMQRATVPLSEVVSDLGSLLNLKAAEKGLTLTVVADGALPKTIQTDSLRLRQILLNVVGNAVKFTDKGTVQVTIKPVTQGDGKTLLAFVVQDSGPGIGDVEAERLFQPFAQADHSTTRKFGGTGLGLVLSRRLARGLGGDVVLTTSRPGSGSTFTVTIDPGSTQPSHWTSFDYAGINRRQTEAPATGASLTGLRILLVEDAPDNRILITRMLKIAEASVDVASNGREGVTMALAGEYDVILMDLQMPEMDGFEATTKLRQEGVTLPIIALTAHALKEDRERCLAHGFSDHLSKPIDRHKLLSCVKSAVAD